MKTFLFSFKIYLFFKIFKTKKDDLNLLKRKMATASSTNNANADYFLVEKNEMENFMERCMLAVGTKPDHAKSLASCLIAGDYRGHFSHGLNRLGNVNA